MEKSVHDNELRYVRIAQTSFQRNELPYYKSLKVGRQVG